MSEHWREKDWVWRAKDWVWRASEGSFASSARQAVVEAADHIEAKQTWQPIETAPHNELVLLYCPDRGVESNRARVELGYASSGYRNAVASTMSYHSWATHWMLLPASPISQTGDGK